MPALLTVGMQSGRDSFGLCFLLTPQPLTGCPPTIRLFIPFGHVDPGSLCHNHDVGRRSPGPTAGPWSQGLWRVQGVSLSHRRSVCSVAPTARQELLCGWHSGWLPFPWAVCSESHFTLTHTLTHSDTNTHKHTLIHTHTRHHQETTGGRPPAP